MYKVDLDKLNSLPSGRIAHEDGSAGFHVYPPGNRNLQRHRKTKRLSCRPLTDTVVMDENENILRTIPMRKARAKRTTVQNFTPATYVANHDRTPRFPLDRLINTLDQYPSIDTRTIIEIYRTRPKYTTVNIETNSTFRGA